MCSINASIHDNKDVIFTLRDGNRWSAHDDQIFWKEPDSIQVKLTLRKNIYAKYNTFRSLYTTLYMHLYTGMLLSLANGTDIEDKASLALQMLHVDTNPNHNPDLKLIQVILILTQLTQGKQQTGGGDCIHSHANVVGKNHHR